MNEKQSRRKLAAIFSAGVQGYSRLMQDEEEATVRSITAYREVLQSGGMIWRSIRAAPP